MRGGHEHDSTHELQVLVLIVFSTLAVLILGEIFRSLFLSLHGAFRVKQG